MRAIVKVAYFDNSGLHKVGEVVEVKKLTSYLKATEEKTETVEPETEEVKPTKKATKKTGNWWLEGCTLYVTLEPCAMCAGAIVNSRLDRVVYGAKDPRFGFLGSLATLDEDYPLNHKFQKQSGVLGEECSSVLTAFFAAKRAKSKKN